VDGVGREKGQGQDRQGVKRRYEGTG